MTLENFFKSQLQSISLSSINAVLALAQEGATVPFIARYRKDKTGNLDEVQVRNILETKELYDETLKRRDFILKEIEGQGNLTDELKKRIAKSFDLGELEEIYRPYKTKRKTKATIARDAGLEPLANWIWQLGHGEIQDSTSLEVKAKDYINAKANLITYDQILKAAQDILIEKIANDENLRNMVRDDIWKNGKIISQKTKKFTPKSKYTMYAEYSEPVKNLLLAKNSHRYLAMRRGWQEAELSLSIEGNSEQMISSFEAFACSKDDSQAASLLKQSAKLAFSVYVLSSVGNEVHRKLKDLSDEHAIDVFAENVKKLLLASPFGAKCVLGVDPGIKTGCKIALVDKSGHYISNTVIYTHKSDSKETCKKMLAELTDKIQLEAIAVGNGTAGRETEAFFRQCVAELNKNIPIVLVNESGASIYSASDIARQEFPDLDLTVKGAISIARRLQDPLAELVKVDPKSIGVGQYQHDVTQTNLKKRLDFVVESCVNQVGVDVNTASESLLAHVSGIGPALAKNIVEFRKTNSLFSDRMELAKVSRLSDKVFEQAAGFLRVYTSKNPLDRTGIHPEAYTAVRDIAKDLGVSVSEIMGDGAKILLKVKDKWSPIIGEFTFNDIMKELEKPGRDPRGEFTPVQFRDDIHEVKDLQEGMICPGVVSNVTNFGAFVDIGVHQDGLVHISELSDSFIEDPRKVVNPGDQVKVRVISVDLEKSQISLSMKLQVSEKVYKAKEDFASNKTERAPRKTENVYKPGANKSAAPSGFSKPGAKLPNAKENSFSGSKPQARTDNEKRAPRPAQNFNNPFAALANLDSLNKK